MALSQRPLQKDSQLPGNDSHLGVWSNSTKRLVRGFAEILQLGTLLAFVGGLVNSAAFLEFGSFVSHISGHATRMALEYAGGHILAAWTFFLETFTFIAGAFMTAFLLRGNTAATRRVKYTFPILLEAFALIVFLILNHIPGLVWPHIGNAPMTTTILTFAMGMQNALLGQRSGVVIRTTHMTGVATDLGFELGTATRATLSVLRHGKESWIEKLPRLWSTFWGSLGLGRFTVHLSIFLSFFIGAVLGTLGYSYFGTWILILPVFILILIGLREYFRPSAELEKSMQPLNI